MCCQREELVYVQHSLVMKVHTVNSMHRSQLGSLCNVCFHSNMFRLNKKQSLANKILNK
jgi:hypothetical protein